MPLSDTYRPAICHLDLGADFFSPVKAADFPAHILRYRNDDAAKSIGLKELDESEWLKHFGNFQPLKDNLPEPLALKYHGHQFRNYNPDIGDGRGFLFAQMYDADDRLMDLGTKGSGQTPFSRFGDGRLTLKGGVREVLAAALLEAQGVNTSKILSLIETGEELMRNDEPSPTRSAVMVRLSHSHIRFGTFQRLAYEEDKDNIERLVDYVCEHYYPQLVVKDDTQKAVQLLEAVIDAKARTVSQWMMAGFVHGVLNTDNMNITGESFDYGPYRFLPYSDPNLIAAYFDQNGIYRFGLQPAAILWNLQQLAGVFALICDSAPLSEALSQYEARYRHHLHLQGFARLGLKPTEQSGGLQFLQNLFSWMSESKISWEGLFFDWYGGALAEKSAMKGERKSYYQSEGFVPLHKQLMTFEPLSAVLRDHKYFYDGSACTLIYDEIEALWNQIADHDDWSEFHNKLDHIDSMKKALSALN